MNIYEVLRTVHIPVAYAKFDKPQTPPFMVYMGAGQDQFIADTTYYRKRNSYTVEYYFTKKSAANEDNLEAALLNNGYRYDKSEDTYIEDENIFVIYYTVWHI